MYNDKENIKEWLRKGDILVADSGFRDSLDHLHLLGYQTYMSALLTKTTKQFETDVANPTNIRWVIENPNDCVKQWRLFDKVLPNTLLKTVGEPIAIICALLSCYGSPLIQFTSKDEQLATKMQQLCDKTNELQ